MADTEEQPSISMNIDDIEEEAPEETVEDTVEEAPEETVEEEAPEEEAPEEEAPEETVEEEAPEETVEEEAPEETVDEAPVEEAPEETVEEEAPLDEAPVEEAPEETVDEAPVDESPVETVEEEAPVDESPVETVEEEAPVDEAPVETVEEEEAPEEPKSLNLRIAELDYLRECCGNWVGKKRAGKALFLKSWSEKDIKEDESVNYESLLIQLEKLPELVRGWGNKSINMKGTNHFKNLNGHYLQKPLFKEEFTVEEKVAVLEKLITLLTDCAQGKLSAADIESQIDDYY